MPLTIIYGDISNNATSGTGTALSPYNLTQIVKYYDATQANQPGNNFYNSFGKSLCYLRGTYVSSAFGANFIVNVSARSDPSLNITIDAWSLPLYGPWKVMGSTSSQNTEISYYKQGGDPSFTTPITFKNGVLGNPRIEAIVTGVSATVSLKGCLVYYGLSVITDNSNIKFYGNTFANTPINLSNYVGSYDNALFENCVFYNSRFASNSFENVQFSGCIFSGSQASTTSVLGTSGHVNDSTFNWVPSTTMPDFSQISTSAQNNMLYTSFGLQPTLSGRPQYVANDYRLGMFGEGRRGMGAFNFGGSSIYFDLFCPIGPGPYAGIGTSSQPFGGDDLVNYLLTNAQYQFENENYILRGAKIVSASTSVNFNSLNGHVTYTNYPNDSWKLNITSGTVVIGGGNSSNQNKNVTLQRGIMYFGTGSTVFFNRTEWTDIESMFLAFYRGSYPQLTYCGNDVFTKRGNTIISPTSGINIFANPFGTQSIYMSDSIVDVNYFKSGYNLGAFGEVDIYLSGCVLSAPNASALDALSGNVNYRITPTTSSIGSTIFTSGSQFNWVPPIWPDPYTYNKSDFSYSHLTSANPITISGTGNWY